MTHEAIEQREGRCYRKKPVVIEEIRLPKPGEEQQKVADLFDFLAGAEWEIGAAGLTIKTLEGTMLASPGDWLIKGVAGEFYPCKPDIFSASYEAAEQTRASTPAVDREAVAQVNDPQGGLVSAELVFRIIEALEIAPIVKQRLIFEIGCLRAEGN